MKIARKGPRLMKHIESMRHVLSVMSNLTGGRLYVLNNDYIAIIKKFNKLTIEARILSIRELNPAYYFVRRDSYIFYYESITSYEPIKPVELPLYVSWSWKSPEVLNYLAGKEEIAGLRVGEEC